MKKLPRKRRRMGGDEGGKMVPKDTRQEEREGEGAVEKERKVENALFFLCHWCTCARNCVSSRYLISKFVLTNGNKTSVNVYVCMRVCVCVYSWSVLRLYRCTELLCYVCIHT